MKNYKTSLEYKLPLFLRLIDSDSEESITMEENNDTKNFFHSIAIELESLFNKKKPGFKKVQKKISGKSTPIIFEIILLYYALLQ